MNVQHEQDFKYQNSACEHGHQRRNCPHCELIETTAENNRLLDLMNLREKELAVLRKDFSIMKTDFSHVLEQRAAMLKLVDKWEEDALKFEEENAKSVHPLSGDMVRMAQASVRTCTKELRDVYADKEQT